MFGGPVTSGLTFTKVLGGISKTLGVANQIIPSRLLQLLITLIVLYPSKILDFFMSIFLRFYVVYLYVSCYNIGKVVILCF